MADAAARSLQYEYKAVSGSIKPFNGEGGGGGGGGGSVTTFNKRKQIFFVRPISLISQSKFAELFNSKIIFDWPSTSSAVLIEETPP